MKKIKNIIATICIGFIVVCNLKYAHDGYGIRNAKPEERGYATTAKPTYRHEKEPSYLSCLGYTYMVKMSDMATDKVHISGVTQKEAYDNARKFILQYEEMTGDTVYLDGYYRSFVTYSTYELKCKPNGTLVDCQDETDVCPEEGVS